MAVDPNASLYGSFHHVNVSLSKQTRDILEIGLAGSWPFLLLVFALRSSLARVSFLRACSQCTRMGAVPPAMLLVFANVLAWVLSRQPCCLFLRRFESKDLAACDAWFQKSSRRVCAQFCHCTLRYNTQHWLLAHPLHLRQDQCTEACVAGQCMAAFEVAVFIKPLLLPR